MRRLATLIGLILALGVPLALFPTGLIARLFPPAFEGDMARDTFWWALTAIVLLVLVAGEGLPLSAIGFKGVRWSSLSWGFIGFVAAFFSWPLGAYLMRAVGGAPPTEVLEQLISLPLPVIGAILVRAAVTEEILFRGYGIERLTALTGSRTVGIVLPGLIFAVCHASAWGAPYVLAVLPVTAVLTLLYVWRRDLAANIIAHFLVDAAGIAILFAQAHHLLPAPPGA